MRVYESGRWGFSLVWGIHASVFPRAFALALPNAVITFLFAWFLDESDTWGRDEDSTKNAVAILGGFTSVLFFVLYLRSNIAYDRWWEGGTLLQKTRGEWFNAYSSLIAFSTTDQAKEETVEEYQHLLARLMSLLFCCGLQQVSPNKDRCFEIIDTEGIEPKSMQFLDESSDKVEVILQWIQRSTVMQMQTGILPVAPPVLSRAFQEVSRGIVNLQNARKIAEFPFPFPFAQTSMVMLLLHWSCTPILCSMLLNRWLAAIAAFAVIFFIWCINYIALQLEQPFGSDSNDLPMNQMQRDWNKSLGTLLAKRAQRPPKFTFDTAFHRKLEIAMSDGSSDVRRRMTIPDSAMNRETTSVARITRTEGPASETAGGVSSPGPAAVPTPGVNPSTGSATEAPQVTPQKVNEAKDTSGKEKFFAEASDPEPQCPTLTRPANLLSPGRESPISGQPLPPVSADDGKLAGTREAGHSVHADASALLATLDRVKLDVGNARAQESASAKLSDELKKGQGELMEEKRIAPTFPMASVVDADGFEQQLRLVGSRMKELHACLIDEELGLLSALGTRLATPDAKHQSGRLVPARSAEARREIAV